MLVSSLPRSSSRYKTGIFQVGFVIDNIWLIVLALVSGGMLLWPLLAKGGSAGITADEAVQMINRNKAVVVDVCDAEHFAAGHVVGARNIPLDELQAQLPAAVKNKATPLVMVCASGIRSKRATAVARKLGYEQVQSLDGGMKGWRQAGLPVSKK